MSGDQYLLIDIETRSRVDLARAGAYRYAEDPSTEILLFGYSLDGGPVQVVDLHHGEELPDEVAQALADPSYPLVAHNCVPLDTEVLTPSGWVGISDIQVGSIVCAWDADTRTVIPQQVLCVTRGRSTVLYEWVAQKFKGAFTPDHRFYGLTHDTDKVFVEPAKKTAYRHANGYRVPLGGVWYRQDIDSLLTPDEARVCEMLRADGSPNGSYSVWSENSGWRLKLKKPRKIRRFKMLCEALGIPYKGHSGHLFTCNPGAKINRFLKRDDGSKGYTIERVLQLGREALRTLIDETRFWDGYTSSRTSHEISSVDHVTLEALQVAAHLSGYSTCVIKGGSNDRGFGAQYSSQLLYKLRISYKPHCKGGVVKRITGDFEVGCISVPARAFIARRKGTVFVCGNSTFERVVLSRKLGRFPSIANPERWYCTSYAARCFGLPASLEAIGLWLGRQKDMTGHRLMMKVCKPDRDGKWRELSDEDWERFKQYCHTDVAVELHLWRTLPQLPYTQWRVYWENEAVNDRGFCLDERLASRVVLDNGRIVAAAQRRWGELTGLASWRQTEAVRQWLSARIGWELPDIRKQTLEDLLDEDLLDDVREAVEIRLTHGRAAVAKFQTALDMRTQDGRLHGLYVAHAAITGRYSSRGVQLHNLRRDCADTEAVEAWLNGDAPMPEPGAMVRSMLVPTPGYVLLVSDYSQIEARITAWLAGEEPLLDAFARGDDVYLRAYERAFNLPQGSLRKATHPQERFIGKTMVLGCGFGAGVRGVRQAMGKRGDQVTDDQIQQMVWGYRRAYPAIPSLWRTLRVALLSLFYTNRREQLVDLAHTSLLFRRSGNCLSIRLPSGRELIYQNVLLEQDGETVTYARPNRKPKQGEAEWPRAPLSGPALIENIVQAIANDCLRAAISAALSHQIFHRVVGHTHDELIVEVHRDAVGDGLAQRFERDVMLAVQSDGWASGLPIACETGLMTRYGK